MGRFRAYMERTERILQFAIQEKLCREGRIRQGEHIATIESPYGGYIEYFMPSEEQENHDNTK